MEIKGMKDEFFDWLDECPVHWFLIDDDKGSIRYSFSKDDGEDLK